MKKVFFNKLDSPANKLLGLTTVIFFIVYLFTSFNSKGSALYKVSAVLSFGLFIIFMGKQIFFRNYISWNKKGMVLKLNSFFSKSLPFNQISSFKFEKDQLEITRLNGKKFTFNLTNIREDHIHRIREILSAYAIGIKSHGNPNR